MDGVVQSGAADDGDAKGASQRPANDGPADTTHTSGAALGKKPSMVQLSERSDIALLYPESEPDTSDAAPGEDTTRKQVPRLEPHVVTCLPMMQGSECHTQLMSGRNA